MAWTEYTLALVKDSTIVLSQLRQELLRLQHNPQFLRNLCLTSLTIFVSSLSFAQVYNDPYRIAKQEKSDQLFQTMSAGVVLKTHQAFPQ